jgi:hypothetical protein
MNANEENLESRERDARPSWVYLLLALVALAAGLAPIGLAAFITDVPAMKHATPWMLPFWVAMIAAAIFALYTRAAKVASMIVFTICGLAILNLGGCAFEFMRIDRALG